LDAASIATGVAGLIIKTLELVHKRREGRLQIEEAQELYARIYASLLWDIGQNLDRCKGMLTKAEGGFVTAGVLSFFVRDALFSDFCIMCPEPTVVAKVNQLYAALERIHHWQRQTTSLQGEGVQYAIGYANDLFQDKGLHNIFNELVDSAAKLAPNVSVPPKVEAPTKALQRNASGAGASGNL
jgi:hypothetical protein